MPLRVFEVFVNLWLGQFDLINSFAYHTRRYLYQYHGNYHLYNYVLHFIKKQRISQFTKVDLTLIKNMIGAPE